jgi:putative transposase
VGIHYKRRGGCTRPGDGELSDDLVNRAFYPKGPDRLWVMDVTEHRTAEGKVYLAVVIDA